jgi:hypothetical protein
MNAGTSSRSAISYNLWDNPQLYDAVIGNITDEISKGGSIDKQFSTLLASITARKAAEDKQTQALTTYADNVGAVASSKAAVEASTAQRNANILTMQNINPDQMNNLFDQAAHTIADTTSRADALGKDIDQRMAVGLFDNPLMWLVNQTRLPGLVGQYNAIANEQNTAVATAKAAQALAGQEQLISNNVDADLRTKEGVSIAAANASKAQAELAAVQSTNAGAAVRDIAVQQQLSMQKADLGLRALALTKERATDTEANTDRAGKAQQDQVDLDNINRYFKMIGRNDQLSPAQFKSLDAKERRMWVEVAGTGTIANSASQALDIIDGKGSASTIASTGSSAFVNWFKKFTAEAKELSDKNLELAKAASATTGKVLDVKGHFNQTMDGLQSAYQAQAADMSTASPNNPLKLDYQVMAQSSDVPGRKTPALIPKNIVSDYIVEALPKLNGKVTEANILDKITQDIVGGTMTASEAANQIKLFYDTATTLQAKMLQYPLVGFTKPDGYVVTLPETTYGPMMNGTRAGTKGLDLQNRAAVEAYLTKNAARNMPGSMEGVPSWLKIVPL